MDWKKVNWEVRVGNGKDSVLDDRTFDPIGLEEREPGYQDLERDNTVSWMAVELYLLVWKKGTWSEIVGNGEDSVLDGSRVSLLCLEEGELGSKSCK